MASYILDENISPVVAVQVSQKAPDVVIFSISHWHNGEYLNTDGAVILQQAFDENLTLITFDLSTIRPLLKAWSEDGRSHGGVIFIDDKTIASNNHGKIVKSIIQVSEQLKRSDFINGVMFLRRPGQ